MMDSNLNSGSGYGMAYKGGGSAGGAYIAQWSSKSMNEARLSHLPFWGPSEGFFLINSTAVGLTRMKRSSFGLRVRVNPWVNLSERFIRVNPTDV